MRQLRPLPQAIENNSSCATASQEPNGPFSGLSGEIGPTFGAPSSGIREGEEPARLALLIQFFSLH
jgi:hypothetical protein